MAADERDDVYGQYVVGYISTARCMHSEPKDQRCPRSIRISGRLAAVELASALRSAGLERVRITATTDVEVDF